MAVLTSRLFTQYSSLLHADLRTILEACTHQPDCMGNDTNLSQYVHHLQALLRTTLALREVPVPVDVLRNSLNIWETLSDAKAPSSDLSNPDSISESNAK